MRRTAKQWQALIQKQLQSGQSAEQFCHKRGISAAYFSQMKRKYRVELPETTPSSVGFIRLPTAPVDKHDQRRGVQLEFRGARITVPEHYSPIWVADLLKALMP
jgi:hypothetical protein